MITEEEYLKDRVEDQINWYDKKSGINKKWFHRTQVLTIVFGALITFVGVFGFSDGSIFRYLSPLLGACVTILSSLLVLYKFQEKWITYRTTSEALQVERNLFLTGCDPYKKKGSFQYFVVRIESILSQENSSWAQTMQPESKDQSDNTQE